MNDPRIELNQTDDNSVVAEPTHSGPVYCPSVDIFETDNAITVLADMPGVRPEDLTVDLRESVLTLTGRISDPGSPKEELLLREHRSGAFYRQFSLAETINQSKIDARLANGVLHLELPKVEKAKPRQVAVRAG